MWVLTSMILDWLRSPYKGARGFRTFFLFRETGSATQKMKCFLPKFQFTNVIIRSKTEFREYGTVEQNLFSMRNSQFCEIRQLAKQPCLFLEIRFEYRKNYNVYKDGKSNRKRV